MSRPRTLNLDQIRLDGNTQVRVRLDQDTIDRYAELMLHDSKLPAITVYYDGRDYWLVDGFHRVDAAKQAKQSTILAHVQSGTQADAQYDALKANKHGLPLSAADRANAVKRALRLHPEYSDRRIAEDIGVSHNTVAKYRAQDDATGAFDRSPATRIGKDGRERMASSKPAADEQEALPTLQDFGSEAGEAATEPTETEAGSKTAGSSPARDCVGHPLPEHLVHAFSRRDEIETLMRMLSQVESTITTAAQQNDPLFSELDVTAVAASLSLNHQKLSYCRPYAICPYCSGDGCKSCKRRGWVTRPTWDMAPSNMKAQLES